MLLQGKATQIAHHRQDVLIHRVNVKQIVLHLPDNSAKYRQIASQNPHLVHQTQAVRDAAGQLQNTQKPLPVFRIMPKRRCNQFA